MAKKKTMARKLVVRKAKPAHWYERDNWTMRWQMEKLAELIELCSDRAEGVRFHGDALFADPMLCLPYQRRIAASVSRDSLELRRRLDWLANNIRKAFKLDQRETGKDDYWGDRRAIERLQSSERDQIQRRWGSHEDANWTPFELTKKDEVA